jgi:uncharacterized protein YbjT (DUF2867 family)
MPDRKKALIAGATGVVGRNLLRHLLTLDDWDVIAPCPVANRISKAGMSTLGSICLTER